MATAAKSAKRTPPPSSASTASALGSSSAAARAVNSNLVPKSQSRPPIANEKRKIETLATKRPVESKMKSPVGTTVSKAEVKLKPEPGSSKTTTATLKTITTTTKTTSTSTTTKSKVKEKKVYTLAGQKFDPPEEREPLRIFYESLSQQIPTSEMAEFWMMEHGLLSPDRSKKAFEKKQRKQKQIRMGTPIKPTPPTSKPESSQRQHQVSNLKNGDNKAKKKVVMDSDDDDDFILSPKRRKN